MWRRLKDGAPAPWQADTNAYKQRFWRHDRPRSEKNGGSRKDTLGSRDYANTVELVFIIWASLNLRPPLPRGWELGDPVRTEDRTSRRADNFIWRHRHVLHA
eukprot:scaffold5638_cov63-Phaeocystis_antarctica.AAC.3